ncbi:MAG: hypothetical protein QUS08_09785 [Methanothrix sp.]|nr:hypothetical protein [Methanothrix sp.]
MLVALIPFTTDLAGEHGDLQMGILPMEVNLLLLGLVFYWEWSYITSHTELLNRQLSPVIVARGKEKNTVIILLSLVCIALSSPAPEWSTLPYIMAPFIQLHGRYRR